MRDLSSAFGVSEATLRQDLERLDAGGYIARKHGGAYLRSIPQQVQSMPPQQAKNMDKKRAIGAAASALVADGDTLIIDSGTTNDAEPQRRRVGGVLRWNLCAEAVSGDRRGVFRCWPDLSGDWPHLCEARDGEIRITPISPCRFYQNWSRVVFCAGWHRDGSCTHH